MPSAATIGSSVLPHDCWSGGTLTSGSATVLIGGKPASTVGDSGTPHSWICPGGSPPHGNVVTAGSATVLIGGKPAARIGDAMSCGTKIGSGEATVLLGG